MINNISTHTEPNKVYKTKLSEPSSPKNKHSNDKITLPWGDFPPIAVEKLGF